MKKILLFIVLLFLLFNVNSFASLQGGFQPDIYNEVQVSDKVIVVDGYHYAKTDAGINAALSALPSTGGKVYLSEGTYTVSAPIIINKSYVTLEGAGFSTLLYVSNSSNCDVIQVTGTTTKQWIIKNLYINGNNDNNTTGNGINIETDLSYGDSKSKIDNIYIYDMAEDGVNMPSGTDLTEISFIDVYVEECKGNGFDLRGSDMKVLNCIAGNNDKNGFLSGDGNSQYTNCKSYGNGQDTTGDYYGMRLNSQRTQVTGCQFQDNTKDGLSIGTYDQNIVGCQFDSNHNLGYLPTGNYSGISISSTSYNVNISGCYFLDRRVTPGQDYAIKISNAYGINIVGNFIKNSVDNGIYMDGSSDLANINISNNIIKNTLNSGAAIYGKSTTVDSNNVTISNNKIYDDQAVHTQAYGIYLTTASGGTWSNVQVFGNEYTGNTIADTYGIPNSTIVSSSNIRIPPFSVESIQSGVTITANACGGVKAINATGDITTNTTNTFTIPSSSNSGCCMDVVNIGGGTITLDNNANFYSAGGTDVALATGDTVRVISNGTAWYQIGSTGNN